MTLYVVTEGDYSDYHIVGIYSTQEKAEAVKKYYNGCYQHPDIEEWKLDEAPEDLSTAMEFYFVERVPIRAPGFTISTVVTGYEWTCEKYTKHGFDVDSRPYTYLKKNGGFVLEIPCDRVKDEAHAIKIAQDEFYKMKAQKEDI